MADAAASARIRHYTIISELCQLSVKALCSDQIDNH